MLIGVVQRQRADAVQLFNLLIVQTAGDEVHAQRGAQVALDPLVKTSPPDRGVEAANQLQATGLLFKDIDPGMAGVHHHHMPDDGRQAQQLFGHGAGRGHFTERVQTPMGLGAQFLQLLPDRRGTIGRRGEDRERTAAGEQKICVDELAQLKPRHVPHQRCRHWHGLPIPCRNGAVDRNQARFG